jgi:hypothetical protein
LLRTENDASETPQEEDNWVAAAEFADSLGAQVFSTSLGYFGFDAPWPDYASTDLDGETTTITQAADLAAARGIVVVNSAGNYGSNGIIAPADGNEVLAIGSVDQCGTYSRFSSQGPSADGRIKPDLTAMGEATFVLLPDGTVRRANGTSFSCPIVSGLAACLLQAKPDAAREQVYEALRLSADRANAPDLLHGYGIPSGPAAYELLTGRPLGPALDPALLEGNRMVLFPNPVSDQLNIAIDHQQASITARLSILDLSGRRLAEETFPLYSGFNQLSITPTLSTGLYILVVSNATDNTRLYQKKIMFQPR